MKWTIRMKCIMTVTAAVLLTACASTPQNPAAASNNNEPLRDTDMDLLFATEFPVASRDDAIARADRARRAREIDKAIFFYVKALKFAPDDADILGAIGRLHQYQGNERYAVRAYSLALKARPDFAEILEVRGLILLEHDDDEGARTDLNHAVVLNPRAWRAYNGLGLLANQQGDHAAAIAYYDAALAIRPDTGPVLNNRGYSKLLSGDLAGARADLTRAAHELGHRQAWLNLGILFTRSGDYERAVATYEEVLPQYQARNAVAEASIARGDFVTAEKLLMQAIAMSPFYFPEAEENLVLVQARLSGG